MSKTQLRHQGRQAFQCKLRVHWQEEGGREVFAVAHTVDISETGMCIVIPNSIPVRSYVHVKADNHPHLSGTASVRFCVRKGMNYAVGLEFSGGVKLKVAAPAVE